VRHAHASSVTIRLARRAEHLVLEVSDDGQGVATERRAGVGLRSMCERAEELGGECRLETAAGGGTRVFACLPLTQNPPDLPEPL
jgi:two-component system NarL family sensor kinase